MANVKVLETSLVKIGSWSFKRKYEGVTVISSTSSDGNDGGEDVEPEFHAWVRGTVTKYNEPFELRVTAFTLSPTPELLGTASVDAETGEYEIDVAPYTGEVMVFAAMDYGRAFEPGYNVAEGQVIHPSTPNRFVYVAKNDGALGEIEPDWPLFGELASGAVTLETKPMYEPLAGGYLKPTVEPK
ncbi:hypothetical protein [Neptunomonas phycophila]|uniref:hypothetical protein n=1 Tax=Neptunomonas phycophila TaxID=1572645 RepID=UPI0026E338D8|nr:hypothetical protein [Neptunomonas phycophila]